MTNYFKVYLTSTKGRQCVVARNKAGVINVLNNANKEGFISYLIIKRIKDTDVPIARGNNLCRWTRYRLENSRRQRSKLG